jgi:hypothetical protein
VQHRKFVVMPIMRGGGEGASFDATEMHEEYAREQW